VNQARTQNPSPRSVANRATAFARTESANRGLLVAVLFMIICVLGVVGWMVYAVIVLNAAPRTAVEREVMKLESLSKTQPTSGEVWADWANALIAAGDLSKATQVIARGSIVASDTAPVRLVEARLRVVQNRPGDAMRVLDTLVSSLLEVESAKVKKLATGGTSLPTDALTSPVLVDAQVMRGEVLSGQDKVEEAIAAYTFALDRESQMADVLAARGDLYARTGKADLAEADYRRALTMVPDYSPAIDGLKRLGRAVNK
jgi:tetratricopeptide (TPR) repeat protein